ncbi:uncharacterized protein LOC135715093 [Ochlerotatus camptorhynchus]|uniref:uncharacterized protein LOC135715093 n=1 Tax=Ochlerotatus camptorhynchus TaxID=644619 RepID=UPI0031E0ECE2
MSTVSQWIKDTERGGVVQDSGVEEENLSEEPRFPPGLADQSVVVDQRQVGQQHRSQGGRRNTIPDFAPEQRSTPQTRLRPTDPTSQRYSTFPASMLRPQFPPRPSVTGPTLTAMEPEPIPVEETICILNRSQMAARQAVSKDLPEFYGNPEDWPLFFSMFTSSTQMCGFSNEENMLRLRKCLKGKALDAVRCWLLHPSNVYGVLTTLKMLYGSPEAIVQAAIRKIHSEPPPEIDRTESLVYFALTVENLVATIEACGVQDFVYNASLKLELEHRLPSMLKLDWAKYTRGNPATNLVDFSTWLYSMAEDASAVMQTSINAPRSRVNKKDGFINVHTETSNDRSGFSAAPAKDTRTQSRDSLKECLVCKGSCPSLAKCKRFVELSYESKWAVIREAKLCRKCLRKHNGTCRQQSKCGVRECTYLHHPLLHSERTEASRNGSRVEAATNTSCNVHQAQTNDVLFRIVPVVLHGPSKMIQTYAFIDDGSELTLMEHSLAQELGLQGPNKALCLKWTGGSRRMENESQKVEVVISSVRNTSQKYKLADVRTIHELKLRPQTLIASEMQSQYSHLTGIPFDSYTEVSPRILIGLDNAQLGHALKSREGKPSEPIPVKTRLGWIVYGSCSSNHLRNHVNYHAVQACECNEGSDESLHAAMKNYFTLDSMGISKPDKLPLSVDDQSAMEILEVVTLPKDGRYESGLLWKYDAVRLPDSKAMALRRWECLERRMKKDEGLAEALRAKMAEYVQKGYVRKLTGDELRHRQPRELYLPVFPVYNPNKPGKLRLVWDAAATVQGISLNSVLLKGPDQLMSLLLVLIQFREFRVAVCGDLREMFHQVLMREEDQHCLRFYWKEDAEDGAPDVYVMKVMTFGACCSPTTAQYVKNINAKRFEHECPQVVDAIVRKHYVGDMLASVETEEEAVKLAQDVKRIHAAGGFEMRNWLSNSSTVLASLQAAATNEKNLSAGEEGNVTEKVLGLWWNTTTDCFTFKVSPRYDQDLLSGDRRPTKREVLRTLMMMFDPLGFITHFLMYLPHNQKLFMKWFIL